MIKNIKKKGEAVGGGRAVRKLGEKKTCERIKGNGSSKRFDLVHTCLKGKGGSQSGKKAEKVETLEKKRAKKNQGKKLDQIRGITDVSGGGAGWGGWGEKRKKMGKVQLRIRGDGRGGAFKRGGNREAEEKKNAQCLGKKKKGKGKAQKNRATYWGERCLGCRKVKRGRETYKENQWVTKKKARCHDRMGGLGG